MICDLAETYRIYDWRAMPVSLLATLVAGLSEDSRVGRAKDGRRVSLGTYFIAELCDMLELLILGLSGKDGSPNRTESLCVQTDEQKASKGYTVDEFARLREQIMRRE